MSKYANDIKPEHLTHPGEILLDELEARGISQVEMSKASGISKTHVNQLVKGQRNITSLVAVRLEKVLGIKAENWINLQNRYDLLHAYKKVEAIRKKIPA